VIDTHVKLPNSAGFCIEHIMNPNMILK